MGFFSGYHGVRALEGLGRLTSKKTGTLSKDARRVVSAFMRGEEAFGNCEKNGGCGLWSDGKRLIVHSPDNALQNAHTLATRDGAGETMEVCIPPDAEFEMGPLKKGQRPKEAERSGDIRATSNALLRAVGAGIGVKTDSKEAKHFFSGSHGKSRIAVPGSCVRVKFDKQQRMLAALTMEAKDKKLGGEAKPTAAQYAKARAEVLKAKNEALAAQRKLQAEEMARNRPKVMAEKAIAKAEAALKSAEAKLFAAREKAAVVRMAENMPQLPAFIPNPAYPGIFPSSPVKRPRKRKAKAAKKAPAKKAPAKKAKGKKGKK